MSTQNFDWLGIYQTLAIVTTQRIPVDINQTIKRGDLVQVLSASNELQLAADAASTVFAGQALEAITTGATVDADVDKINVCVGIVLVAPGTAAALAAELGETLTKGANVVDVAAGTTNDIVVGRKIGNVGPDKVAFISAVTGGVS